MYEEISSKIYDEIENNLGICFTADPYESNYFFEDFYNLAVVSFFGWNHLTDLPLNNGVVFFISAVISRILLKKPHLGIRGCINEFWFDKTDVDIGMRTAYVCQECKEKFYSSEQYEVFGDLLDDISSILDDLSTASRRNIDILSFWDEKSAEEFDVFLCYNSEHERDIYAIYIELVNRGVQPWLDKEQLRPGLHWQNVLEEQITKIKSAAIFVGSEGIGPWQNVELRSFIGEFIKRGAPVIPVILPNTVDIPKLPLFLEQFTWVDLREEYEQAFNLLIWGITGMKQSKNK